MKQYLFDGPQDGKVVSVGQHLASLPILLVARYSIAGEPDAVDSYELRPYERRDRRYYCSTRPYPRPGPLLAASPLAAAGENDG